MTRLIVLVLVILAFALGLAFSFHNPQQVTLNYLLGSVDIALGVLLIATLAVSVTVMLMLGALLSLPRRATIARLKRRIDKAESELANLRQLPLKDE